MAGAAVSLDASIRARRQSFVLDMTLQAASGQAIAIVGRNGAGKSTLLRALAGVQPSSGRVLIDGTDVTARPPHQRSVGWVPQDGALFPHLSALDNVAFGCAGQDRRGEGMRWLAALDIQSLADRRPAQLSGGQAQKVALARALARRPRLLLLDEPLGALDPTARADLRDVLARHLTDFDGVVLLVTHDEEDALSLCRRHVRLDAGRVVADDAA